MDAIDELLTRGVEKIYPTKEELEKVLRSGKLLRVYQGFDATSPKLHIGHLVGLRKLRQWQDLGHEVIFLIGDFTGMIGDPTGKDKTRIPLTHEQVLKNAQTYKEQVGKIVRFTGDNPVVVKYNSEWLGKLTISELAKFMSYLTYQQVIERDMFQNRIKNNMDIAVSELLYPFMQGYDSVAMDVDVEVGGSDQMFNMLMGRTMLHRIKRKNKFVMTTPILTDSQGKKIGKTEGNVIALAAYPQDFYSMIMDLDDSVIVTGFEYLTDISLEKAEEIRKALRNGANPLNYKKQFAYKLTSMLHSEEEAKKAQEFFEKGIQEKETNKNIPPLILDSAHRTMSALATVVYAQFAKSNSEARRLIEQKGFYVNNKPVQNPNEKITYNENDIIRKGSKTIKRTELKL